jgi:hypothetical protein
MADNVDVTEGAGKTIATDDVGGAQYQRVKLDFGTDGAAAPALAGAGAVATGVQRVTLASDDPAVALLTTIDADTGAIKTAAELLDNAVDGNYLNVNVNAAGTDLSMNAGVLTAQTQRVTIATDDEVNNLLGTIDADTGAIKTAVELLDNAVDGAYLNVNCNIAGTDFVGGAGVNAAGVQRVTIATDDECNNFLGTIDADTGAIKTAVELLDNAVDGAYLNVNMNIAGTDVSANAGVLDAQTQRVTIATDDEVNNLLGTIDADTGAIKTAVEIMDDWDAVHDSAASSDGPQMMAAYDATKPTAVADGDAVRVLSDEYGRLLSGVEKTRWQAVFDSANATAEANVVHASAASTIVVVQSYVISSDVEGWIKLQDEDSTALTGKFWLKAGGGVAITLPDKAPIVLGVDKDLEVIAEAAGNVSVSATGYTIPG